MTETEHAACVIISVYGFSVYSRLSASVTCVRFHDRPVPWAAPIVQLVWPLGLDSTRFRYSRSGLCWSAPSALLVSRERPSIVSRSEAGLLAFVLLPSIYHNNKASAAMNIGLILACKHFALQHPPKYTLPSWTSICSTLFSCYSSILNSQPTQRS
jgi:hypothetical protein